MVKTIEYDGEESIEEYIRRVEEYKVKIITEKYDVVLNFLNELLKLGSVHKFKSLREFKRIKEEDICKNSSHNLEVIQKYSKKFKKKLGLTFKLKKNKRKKSKNKDQEDEDEDEDDQEEDNEIVKDKNSIYVITVIQRILKPINFTLISKKLNSGRYYSIRN